MNGNLGNDWKLIRVAIAVAFAMLLAGCLDDGSSNSASTNNASTSASGTGSTGSAQVIPTQPASEAANIAPTIAGSPAKSIAVGGAYSFKPSATDPDGDKLSFTIANKPVWASFNSVSGALSGVPGAAHVGTYSNITVTASDGSVKRSLPTFQIAVTQIATGTATLSWLPPTEDVDGSPLQNLSGYEIHYGTSASALTKTVKVTNASVTRYMVENLSPATWYFAVTAYTTAGLRSDFSGIVNKTIR